jgi:tRNA G18 (ribose-2'-O)-methylase SpoU
MQDAIAEPAAATPPPGPPAGSRGYFGIGAEGVSKSENIGALLRTAHAFGASFCFTLGTGFDNRAGRLADTAGTPAHVPLWRFDDAASLVLPQGCVLVGIELLEDAVDLPSFRHPLSAAYVLGPERAGLSPELLARCRHVVRIPTRFALNLAVAGALVLYDRLLQHGRFAERPVATGGPAPAPPAPRKRHGTPVFRAHIPDWVARDRREPS